MLSAPVSESKAPSLRDASAARSAPGRVLTAPWAGKARLGNRALLQRQPLPGKGGGPGFGDDPDPGAGDPQPMQVGGGAAPTNCGDICDRAYADPVLKEVGKGGTVICFGAKKCPCVFDPALRMSNTPVPFKRGDCPDYDRIVLDHETRHLPEAVCDPKGKLHKAGWMNPNKATALECQHRRESVAEMDRILPGLGGNCKTGVQMVSDDRKAWIAANCGGSP